MADRLYCKVMGDGPDLVMVHGWGMNSAVWLEFAELLSTRFRVTCFDLPGHGLSKPIDIFTLETVSGQLLAQAPQKAVWLGWSLGALITLSIASRHPDRVSSLIMLAGSAKFVTDKDWPGMSLELLEGFVEALQGDRHGTLLRFLIMQGKGALLKELRKRIAEMVEPDEKTLEEGLAILKQADLRKDLQPLRCPVQFVLGTNDTLIPVAAGTSMLQRQPAARLDLIQGAGHLPFLSHPDETFSVINNFLND